MSGEIFRPESDKVLGVLEKNRERKGDREIDRSLIGEVNEYFLWD